MTIRLPGDSHPNLIVEKFALIMDEIGAVERNHQNKQQGYAFRSYDDVIAALQPLLAKHQVAMIPSFSLLTERDRITEKGSVAHFVMLEGKFLFRTIDNSELIAITIGSAIDYGDKACNKAMTAAQKYCICQTFAIPTQEAKDGDADSPTYASKSEARAHLLADLETLAHQCKFPEGALWLIATTRYKLKGDAPWNELSGSQIDELIDLIQKGILKP